MLHGKYKKPKTVGEGVRKYKLFKQYCVLVSMVANVFVDLRFPGNLMLDWTVEAEGETE